MVVGPSGSAVTVFSRTVELSDAEIKTLPSSAVEIVPAPGAGKVIVPLNGFVRLNNEAGAYAVTGGTPIWQLVHMSAPITKEASGFVACESGLIVPGLYSAPIPALSSFDSGEGYLSWGLSGDDDVRVGVALGVQDKYNGVNDYTGGNATNTLTVTVVYTIVSL